MCPYHGPTHLQPPQQLAALLPCLRQLGLQLRHLHAHSGTGRSNGQQQQQHHYHYQQQQQQSPPWHGSPSHRVAPASASGGWPRASCRVKCRFGRSRTGSVPVPATFPITCCPCLSSAPPVSRRNVLLCHPGALPPQHTPHLLRVRRAPACERLLCLRRPPLRSRQRRRQALPPPLQLRHLPPQLAALRLGSLQLQP